MKTSVFCGTSLDGFIARENDGLDFLPNDPGEGHDSLIVTRVPVLIG